MNNRNIIVEVVERVQRITIDRQRKKNSLTNDMYAAMADALAAGETDNQIRVHYFTGAGGVFTAGNDVGTFLNTSRESDVWRFLENIRSAEKPIVVAVNGLAIGVGVTMLMHADLVYAGEQARFRTPFVDLGLVPEAGSSLLMPMTMGYARAARLLLLGETFDAKQAYEVGLVGEVVADTALETHAFANAVRLATRAPAALRASKRLMRRVHATVIKETMDTESELFLSRLGSPEVAEAVQAFQQKRAPDFSAF